MERDVTTLKAKIAKANNAAKVTFQTDLDKTKKRLLELKKN